MPSIQVNTLDSSLNLSVDDNADRTIPDQGKIMNAAGATTGFRTTGPVAVLEDADPWGYNSVEDILNTHGPMELDVIPSTNFGTVNLTKYQKVIISSRQSASFYSYLDSNKTWLEDYVIAGGVLEVHAATFSSEGAWILPFDIGLVWIASDDVEVADPTHYVLNNPNTINAVDLDGWSSSTHGYFNNTGDATIILTNSTGGPVLIEQRFGFGYIIATAQPVEWAYGYVGYTDLLENLVWYMPTTPNPPDEAITGSVAVLQDVNAWGWLGANATQEILVKYGIDYDIINSSLFGTADLSGYQKVIISADQGLNFYNALGGSNRTWLEDYVSAGGILEVHAATQGPDWILPGGMGFNYIGSDVIEIFDPSHYTLNYHYWIREPDFQDWSWSTHGYFNETGDADIILTDSLEPVFVEKALDNGIILATGQTLEFAWHFNFSYFLENLILFAPLPPSVTVTDPNGGELITGEFNITWDAADANKGEELTFDLLYWDSAGSSWTPITTGLTTTLYEWDTSGLPDGTEYKVRIIVYDGRFTVMDESDTDFSINNHGPTISGVGHGPSAPTTADTINVTAEITDGNGVKSVELMYKVNGGGELGVAMTKDIGDSYAVDFPVSFAVDDVVEYYIKAKDNNDFEAESTTKSFTVAAAPGIPGFSLTVAMLSLLSCGAVVYLIRRKRR
ncbi:MAG: hypothetical protein ACFFCZ_29030 [Promethearchaeota archaeon]